MVRIYISLILIFLLACNRIENGAALSKPDIERIQQLNLIDSGETIYKFFSQYKKARAGNFFTDRRIAMYWIGDRYKDKNERSFAFYPDIQSIDTNYNPGTTYCPYMLITRVDGTQFKVYADGKRDDIKSFFEEAMKKWSQNRLKTH